MRRSSSTTSTGSMTFKIAAAATQAANAGLIEQAKEGLG